MNGEPYVPQGIGWKNIDKGTGLADQNDSLHKIGLAVRAAFKTLWGT